MPHGDLVNLVTFRINNWLNDIRRMRDTRWSRDIRRRDMFPDTSDHLTIVQSRDSRVTVCHLLSVESSVFISRLLNNNIIWLID